VGGFLLLDRLLPLERCRQHNDVAGFIYAIVGTLYAISLAFVVATVWGYYEDAKAAADTEAVAVQTLCALARGFGGLEGLAMAQAELAYAQSVIRDEWPLLASGEASPRADPALGMQSRPHSGAGAAGRAPAALCTGLGGSP
jgi:hypothetical protein